MKQPEYFLFFENCLIVKGINRSLLVDLQYYRYKLIPNLLLDLLKDSKIITIEDINKKSKYQYDEGLGKYITYFLEHDWGFMTEKPDYFPKLDLVWDYPGIISNSIIDIESDIPIYLQKVLRELETIGCEAIQLRFYKAINIDILSTINLYISNLAFPFIEIYSLFDRNIEELIKKNSNEFTRFRILNFYNSPEDKTIILKNKNGVNLSTIRFYKEKIDINSCGKVDLSSFIPDLMLFTESQKHNTCLNRKISIDVNGEIKNCPSMAKSYGNIKNTTLKEAIEKAGFKDVWYIHKDQIDVCKDCEFRHICTDCMAYIQDPNNIYSKPAKCSYDPYTATWGEENPTNNPLYGQ